MRALVIVDRIRVWRAEDLADRLIDYSEVEPEVLGYMEAFRPGRVSFDSWQSMAMIQNPPNNAQHAACGPSCDLQPSELGRMCPSVGPMMPFTATPSIAMMGKRGEVRETLAELGSGAGRIQLSSEGIAPHVH